MIVAITNRGIFRLLSIISSSTLRIALQESNILRNEKFSTPSNSAYSYTFRGDAKKCLFHRLHSCFHDNNGCLCAVWGLIFIQKHCLKSLKCLSHYLTLNKKITNWYFYHTWWHHSYLLWLPESLCKHTNWLFISVQFQSFLL